MPRAAILRNTRSAALRFPHRTGRRRTGRSLAVGDYVIKKTGVSRFDWHDPYYFAVALSWPRFLLSLIALFAAINLIFAMLYLLWSMPLANAHPGSLSDAFFFSLETATTVGYGDMYPTSLYGRIVAGSEMMVGVAFTALTTGLLFVRFSRPKASMRYAKNAVVALHEGHPTLMIRLANARFSLISNASAHLGMIRINRENGQPLRQVYELPLIRSRLPLFTLTWTLMHPINEASPLAGYDAARLVVDDVHLWVSIEGRDGILATTIVDTNDYRPTEILFGMRYTGTISADADGHPIADLSEIGKIEADIGPEPLQSGWVDA